jgi:hypothetical protein
VSTGVYRPAQDVVDALVHAIEEHLRRHAATPSEVFMSPQDLSNYNKGVYGHCGPLDMTGLKKWYNAKNLLWFRASRLLKPGEFAFEQPTRISKDGSTVLL